jgi:hypothetical protein
LAHSSLRYGFAIGRGDRTGTTGDTEIRRYHVSSNPNVADAANAAQIITLDQPSFNNHKPGWR